MEEIRSASENCNDIADDDRLTIADFLSGKNIFITGGTGFLGTILIERLLSSTTKIGKIYLLIRAKNGHSAESRVERLMSKVVSSIFYLKQITKRFSINHYNNRELFYDLGGTHYYHRQTSLAQDISCIYAKNSNDVDSRSSLETRRTGFLSLKGNFEP